MDHITVFLRFEANHGWFIRDRGWPYGKRITFTYSSNGPIRDATQRLSAFAALRPHFAPKWVHSWPIYHYTSFDNFKNIATGKELWASHHSIMNDFREIETAVDIIIFEINNHFRESGKLSYIHYQTIREELTRDLDFYVISFSHQPSTLSQWRAYAFPRGISIGFPSGLFSSGTCDLEPFTLGPVLYDGEAQIGALRPLARKMINSISAVNLQDYVAFVSAIFSHRKEFANIAPFIKNSQFYEEDEVRLVTNGVGYPKFDRPDGRGNFVKIDLRRLFSLEWTEDLTFCNCYLSPHDAPDEYIKEFVQFMHSVREPFDSVEHANIPLRAIT